MTQLRHTITSYLQIAWMNMIIHNPIQVSSWNGKLVQSPQQDLVWSRLINSSMGAQIACYSKSLFPTTLPGRCCKSIIQYKHSAWPFRPSTIGCPYIQCCCIHGLMILGLLKVDSQVFSLYFTSEGTRRNLAPPKEKVIAFKYFSIIILIHQVIQSFSLLKEGFFPVRSSTSSPLS